MEYKKVFNIEIDKINEDESKERIRKLLKSFDPNYWLMKDRQQKLDKLKGYVNTKGCK